MPQRENRHRSTKTSRGGIYAGLVRDHVATDPLWNYRTVDGRWICPYCLKAVRPSNPDSKTDLHRAIEGHLSNRCNAFNQGHGTYRSPEELAAKLQHENIAFTASTDPAWQVFDHDGYWYSPASLKKVFDVRIHNRRFDAFTIDRIVNHLATCPDFQQGIVHPAKTVQRARDAGMRIDKLAVDIERLLGHSIWRYHDRGGNWVCPYCLKHDTGVIVDQQTTWVDVTPLMARHLLMDCTSFGPDKQVIQSEDAVRAAAREEPPERLVRPPTTRYRRTRSSTSDATPIATPLGSPTGLGMQERVASDAVTRPPTAPPVGTPPPPPTAQPVGAPPPPPSTSFVPNELVQPPTSSLTPGSPPLALPVEDNEPRIAMPVAQDKLPRPASRMIQPEMADDNLPTTDTNPQPETAGIVKPVAAGGTDQMTTGDSTTGLFGADGDSVLAGTFLSDDAHEDSSESFGNDDALSWMVDETDKTDTGTRSRDAAHTSDLMRARDLQIGLLRDEPQIPGFTFGSRFESCSEVSGDFYEYIQLAGGRIGFAQGDVSGHGMQAGLIMSMAKKVLSIYAKTSTSPAKVLAEVNDALAEDLGGKMFVSITYGILDPGERTITWARAGHNPTLCYNIHDQSMTEINPPGMVVGMKGGSLFGTVTKEQITEVRSGDLFLIYTDGVTETMNRQGDEYGTDLLKELIERHATEDVEHILDRILDSVRGFRGGTETQDDMTLTALLVH